MLSYTYLTHHIVPGPQSVSYFIPIALLPIALLVPRTVLSKWQNICLFMPSVVASTVHAWTQIRGVDVISVDVLLWALYILVLKDPWKDFRYVATSNPSQNDVDGKNDEVERGRPYPPTLHERISWVGALLISIRLEGWTIRKHSHDTRQRAIRRTTTRVALAKQASLSFIRGYLILDLTCAYQSYDPYFTDLNTSISSPLPFSESTALLFPRLFRSCIMGAQVWALISQFIYTPCLIFVSLNAIHWLPDEWSPHTWAPFFGEPKTILQRGVRGLWGQYWHQSLRVLTSAPGEAVADALHIKERSLLRYAIITTIAFGLSGVIHMGLVPPEPLYASMGANEIRLHVACFFWLQPVAVMMEVCAIRVAWRFSSLEFFETKVGKGLKMAVTLMWLVMWLSLCLPVFGEAAKQLGYWQVLLVPVSLWRGLRGEGWVAWR